MIGSSIAGWICPAVSIAREVTVCSPGGGLGQSRDQIFQAYSASSLWSMVAGIHGPSSIFTSTRSIGAPHATPIDAIIRAYLRNPRRSRLEAGAPDGCLGPDRFAVVIFLADGDVVAPHEQAHEAPVAHFDALQPFGVGDAVPARRDQPQRETVGRRQRRSVHLVAEDVVGAHGIFERHAASEVLLELDVADGVVKLDLAGIGAPEHHLDAVLENSCLFEDRGERRAGPASVADAADEESGKPMIARAFDREDEPPVAAAL